MVRFIILVFCVAFLGCESADDVKSELEILQGQRATLSVQVDSLRVSATNKRKEISNLDAKLRELKMYESGKVPVYILKLQLKQSRFSLDIGKHVKDSMNKINFEMPVSKEFYDQVSVGTNIVDQFRSGSFILYGSMGSWKMKVVGKELR